MTEFIFESIDQALPPMPQNSPKMGWFCSYTPLELIIAAGFEPYRISGHNHPIEKADAYMYQNLCQYIRSSLDELLNGKYDCLSGVFFVNSCDGMRRLHDIWTKYHSTPFHHIFDLPMGFSAPDEKFLYQEMVRARMSLENFLAKAISNTHLDHAIRFMNHIRSLIHQINKTRKYTPPHFKASHIAEMIQNLFTLPVNDWIPLLKTRLEDTARKSLSISSNGSKPRILLIGTPIYNIDFIRFIEDCDLDIVYDDICTGSRQFDIQIKITKDPLEGLAHAYLHKPSCARMMRIEDRIVQINKKAEEYGIDGIIHHTLKFCDTNQFDAPVLKQILGELGYRTLFIESDCTLGGYGQLKTRIEAFTEILRGK